jgi:D-glycero-alpha-D-manno-heptose-7-phosphate kinase
MIITRTPYRVSLFGGGSDMPIWYQKNLGAVVSFTIDKFCYIFCRELPPFFEFNYRLAYSKVETRSRINEIEHPALREGIRNFTDQKVRLEIQHHGDLPARSGIGSSSSFAVGLINALNTFSNKSFSQKDLANQALDLEQTFIGDKVGSQDQIACTFGGINFIEFSPNFNWRINPIALDDNHIQEIEDRCYLVYSKIARFSSKITEVLLEGFDKKHDLITKTVDLANQGLRVLRSDSNYDEIGALLNEGWELKKSANPSSVNSTIELFITGGIEAGALGAKVLGAGGGGFILFWLKHGDKERFRKSFTHGVEVPFQIEFKGSSVINF